MTRVPSQYDIEIKELDASIDGQRQRLSELRQKRAVETCEFKVGDKLVLTKGRMAGQRGEVVRVRDSFGEGIATVQLYKKDGSLSRRTTEAYSWYGWGKLTEKEE